MAPKTANRLARRLLQVYGEADQFFFEVDTAENAALLASKFQSLGCEVAFADRGFRINVTTRRKEDA